MSSESTAKTYHDVGTLDLTGMTAEDLANVESIHDVGTILVPESLMGALAKIPISNVGDTIPVPDGKKVQIRNINGPVQMGGDSFSTQDDGTLTFMMLNGPLVFTSPVTNTQNVQLVINGPVFAPHGSGDALGAAIQQLNGPLVYYNPGDGEMKVHTGMAKLHASAFANTNGKPEDILLIAGQLFVTGTIESIGYRQVYIVGQALIPKENVEILSSYMEVTGQAIWYPGDTEPRLFNGEESFSTFFFEYLDESITMIINGEATFDDDVTVDMVRENVREVILNGVIKAPKHLVPLLQVLAKEKNGVIQVMGEDEA